MNIIFSSINKLRQKPERTRIRILWISVLICMVLVFFIWLAAFDRKKAGLNISDGFEIFKNSNFSVTSDKIAGLEKGKDDSIKNAAYELEKSKAEIESFKYLQTNDIAGDINDENIRIVRSEKKDGVWHIEYKQYFKNIPVELSEIKVTVPTENQEASIEKAIYYPDINIDTMAELTDIQALDKIRQKIERSDIESKSAELVIYTLKKKESESHYLAWKINAYVKDPTYNHTLFLDADSGKLLDDIENQNN